MEAASKKAIAEAKAQQTKAEQFNSAAVAKQGESKKASDDVEKAKLHTGFAAAIAKATQDQAADNFNFKLAMKEQ